MSIFESAADRKIKVAKDKKLKLLRMDSDDELSDNSDEYASVNLSDDENANPTTKMAILEAQQKIVDAGSGGCPRWQGTTKVSLASLLYDLFHDFELSS